ncbi:hypothetical protein MMC10_009826 [Thelotrema lepadinum]|nr:hypothetical protein [Thelotrema lepadinum]
MDMPSPETSPTPASNIPPSNTDRRKLSRQRPGAACSQCHSKKLKCDGKQPQCGKCVKSGTKCTFPTDQSQRGPKKGHLKVLQNKIEMLEQRLAQSENKYIPDMEAMSMCLQKPLRDSTDSLFDMSQTYVPSHMFLPSDSLLDPAHPLSEPTIPLPSPPNPISDVETGSSSSMQGIGLPNSLDPQANCIISDFLRTDLNQIYFERVQHSIPILHRRTYFSWATSHVKTESQICLQYSMWTIAASLASQLQDICESLYQCTQRLLDALEGKDKTFHSIEHVQARLLICVYELTRKNHQRGWISAGRCFRLMQLMRLHEIDAPENVVRRKSAPEPDIGTWIREEERRRTFWMGYSLDIFISVQGKWPLTLHEHTTSTRLPVPEDNFQNDLYVEMPCLTDATQLLSRSKRSPFTESIILASICRHLAVHRQCSALDMAQAQQHQQQHQALWDRHSRLDEMVKAYGGLLLLNYPTSLQHSDPLLLFTSMMAHAVVLCLYSIVELVGYDSHDRQNAVAAFRQRAPGLARSILDLSRSLGQLSYLKMHPLTPLPLRECVEFLNAHQYLDEAMGAQVQEMYDLLSEMGNVNNLAHDFLLG